MNITINNSDDNISPVEKIDEVNIYSVKNVISYKYYNNVHDILCNNNIVNSEHKYFLFEMSAQLSREAFAHWIIEGAILIPVFKKIKSKYSNIKLHLHMCKKFKTLFLNYFNINENDISYTLEPNNECFITEPFTFFDNKLDSSLNFKLHFTYVVNFFNSIRPQVLPEKDIDILFLPRQTKENFIHNDRNHNTKQLEDSILLMDNCYVLHTDNITDLKDQINFILRAKNIIVTDGSPYIINSLISLNANIICIGRVNVRQITCFTEMAMIQNSIELNNKVHIIEDYFYTFESVKNLLS